MNQLLIVLCIFFIINTYILYHKIKKANLKVKLINKALKELDISVEKYNKRLMKFAARSVSLDQAKSIESEMFDQYAKKKIDSLRNGLNKDSNELLDYVLNTMKYWKFFKNSRFEKYKLTFPAYQYEYEKCWLSEHSKIGKIYNLASDLMTPEVFYFHHGLRFADQKILDYIKNKDILDCGAFIGDSVLVLQNYTQSTIYCYEFSKPNIEAFKNLMKANNCLKYRLISAALGDKVQKIFISKSKKVNSHQKLIEGSDEVVDITTIDEDAKKYGFNVGLIKMDVQGAGMSVVRGGVETIKKHRPVLSLAVYHNTDELFGIKPFLEKHLDNYVFEFKLQQFHLGNFDEMILFAYPREIMEGQGK